MAWDSYSKSIEFFFNKCIFQLLCILKKTTPHNFEIKCKQIALRALRKNKFGLSDFISCCILKNMKTQSLSIIKTFSPSIVRHLLDKRILTSDKPIRHLINGKKRKQITHLKKNIGQK